MAHRLDHDEAAGRAPAGALEHGSPGLDELRWLAPVHPDDRLTLMVEALELLPSRSKPDRGIVKMAHELINQHGTRVVRSVANMMIARRHESGAELSAYWAAAWCSSQPSRMATASLTMPKVCAN